VKEETHKKVSAVILVTSTRRPCTPSNASSVFGSDPLFPENGEKRKRQSSQAIYFETIKRRQQHASLPGMSRSSRSAEQVQSGLDSTMKTSDDP
jgi:hypothetical protein